MEHIQTIELGSSQASIEFTSIPQDYDDLVFKMSLRTTAAGVSEDTLVSFNGSTADFSIVRLFGRGNSFSSSTGPARYVGFTNNASATANTFSNMELYVSNYTSSSAKSYSEDSVTENNATSAFMGISAGLWNDTSAITSATLSPIAAPNFESGCVISLYGVTAGGDGTVTSA